MALKDKAKQLLHQWEWLWCLIIAIDSGSNSESHGDKYDISSFV